MTEKQHAELGASVSKRWMNCPGSVALVRTVPRAEGGETSVYAGEGTAAHALGDHCLTKQTDPAKLEGVEFNGFTVDDDMIGAVGIYVDYCKELIERCGPGNYWIERKFNLVAIKPPAPMFGTGDFSGYERATKTLHVVDYKHGRGVLVEVKENPQLLYYALGLLLTLDLRLYPVNAVNITVVQPRMAHADGVVRHWVVDVQRVLDFAGDLLAAADAALAPNAPLKAGEHCKFCPASAICPEQRKHTMLTAQIDFEHDMIVPPEASALSNAVLGDLLPKLSVIEGWMKSVRIEAMARIAKGEVVPGFKAVAKRANRKWVDQDVAVQLLASMGRTNEDDIFEPRKLKSPAQIEKLVTKKKFKDSPLVGATQQVSSGYSLVPEADARPAVALSAGDDFAGLLEAGTSSAGS